MMAGLLGSLVFVLVLGALLYSSGLANARSMDRSREATPSVYASLGHRRSHNHRYFAEVTATTALKVGERQRWTFRLNRHNGSRVSDATVIALALMPETGTRATVQPRVSYAGGGVYTIDDVMFSRHGWWTLALIVDGKAGIDSLAFNIILPE